MDFINKLLRYINDGKISKQSVDKILWAKGCGHDIDFNNYFLVDENEIVRRVKKIIEENKNIPKGAIIGQIMKEFRGKVDGKKVSQIIDEYLTRC